MTEFVFKLPDLGEGTVEAEIVEWHVKPGDVVKEGDVIVDVMTDKANIEVPAPVDGKVLRTSGQPGDVVAVGTELIAFEASEKAVRRREQEPAAAEARVTEREPAEEAQAPEPAAPKPKVSKPEAPEPQPAEPRAEAGEKVEAPFGTDTARPEAVRPRPPEKRTPAQAAQAASRPGDDGEPASPATGGRVITSPAIRRRAKEAGIDLRQVAGTGPRGRILRMDFERALAERPAARSAAAPAPAAPGDEFEEHKVIGVRRVIAERMSQSKREIPHFGYVEEVDVTELEALRRHLTETRGERLTVLPFIAIGLIRALREFPQCNARYDAERNMLQRYRPAHLGIATQTADGLKVPVVRNAQALDLWQLAREIARVAEAARTGKATRAELSGSTITITSLGRIGGIVTTPVINYPEVAILGVNKAVDRPVVLDGQIRVRTMMNLSSSFDHRFVDGFDAAAMIQKLKGLLEHPATLFL
ncbi:MAG TPA: 2-oxo acid dehydrogenase subunit E2 [Pseudomonadales bacterium]